MEKAKEKYNALDITKFIMAIIVIFIILGGDLVEY